MLSFIRKWKKWTQIIKSGKNSQAPEEVHVRMEILLITFLIIVWRRILRGFRMSDFDEKSY